jgi:PAS domain S-box-containing protein
MNKKILSASDDIGFNLKVLAKEKESIRRKLVVTAEKLRLRAKQLAVTAKEKESIRRKLVATVEKLRLRAKQLAVTAKEKESIRRQLVMTAKEKERATKAVTNVLEDLKIKEESLIEINAKEEAILLSIGEGLLATDEKGNIILINKIGEELLGMKSEEIMGKIFSEIISIEDEKGVSIPLQKHPISMVLETGNATATSTYYYARKDKTRFPMAVAVAPIVLDFKIIGTIKVFRDITREKEIDKAKSEFVSLASHQLRTPLTSISWYTEMILKGDVGDVIPGQKKYLEEIYQGNQRMIELVNTLLDVSRIELGTFKVEPKPTDIIKLAESVLNEQKVEIEKNNLIITENFSKNVPIFSTDPKLLRMVFQNLLSNAVAYTPINGKIEFAISFDGKKTIRIKVSDTGYGIPKNQQDQIFTKLFRADNIRDKETDGTGLGLYIVKSIVKNSGGEIWFESEENKGTTFYVSLPLAGMKEKEDTT